jgi:hypothetical protein
MKVLKMEKKEDGYMFYFLINKWILSMQKGFWGSGSEYVTERVVSNDVLRRFERTTLTESFLPLLMCDCSGDDI